MRVLLPRDSGALVGGRASRRSRSAPFAWMRNSRRRARGTCDERGRVRRRVVAKPSAGCAEGLGQGWRRWRARSHGWTRRRVGSALRGRAAASGVALHRRARSGRHDRPGVASARARAAVGRQVAAALCCSRLCSPSPLYDVAGGRRVRPCRRPRCSTTTAWAAASRSGGVRRDAARRARRPGDGAFRDPDRPAARRLDDLASGGRL